MIIGDVVDLKSYSGTKSFGGICSKRILLTPAIPNLEIETEFLLRMWSMPQSIVWNYVHVRPNSFLFKENRLIKNGVLCYNPRIVMAFPSDYYARLFAAYEYGRNGFVLSWTDGNGNKKFAGRPGYGLRCTWERNNKEVRTEQNEIVLSFSAILDTPVLELV